MVASRNTEEAVAKFLFEADNKQLLKALDENAERTEKFNKGTKKTLEHLEGYEKKTKPAIEALESLGKASTTAYGNTKKLADVSASSFGKVTGTLEATSKASEILDSRMLRLGASALGMGDSYDRLAGAIGPAADLFDEFANSGSAAESTFLALNRAEKPLQTGLGATAKSAELLADRFGMMGDRGGRAAEIFDGMSGALSGVSRSIGIADSMGDIFRAGIGMRELAGEAVPMVGQALSTLSGPVNAVFGPIIEKTKTWEGRLELLSQASTKLKDNQAQVVAVLASAVLQAGKFIAIGKQFKVVADTIRNTRLELANMNEAMGVFEAMGIDTSMAEFARSLTSLSLGFATNTEKAQEFFNVTISGYAQLEDQLATVNTLSAGQAAGMDNMGQSMLDLVNGPLKNQISSLDATNALYNTMSAGITDLGDAQRFMAAGLKLSSATGADSAQTLEVLAKTQKAYGLSASEAAATAAKLNGVVENGITTFPQLTSGLSRTASVARASGVSLDEMLGSIAALTQTMTTDDSLTGYASLLQAVASQGEQSAAAVSELGVRFDVNRIKAVGLQQALSELYDASGGNVETLKRIIPDSLAFQTALQLMTSASEDAANNLEKIGNTGAESLDQLFDSRRESSMQRVSAIMRSFDEIARDLGGRVVGMLEPAIGILEGLRDFFVDMPNWMKNGIAAMALFGLGARTAAGVVGELAGGLLGLAKNYLTARAATLLFQGELMGELKIVRQMIEVNGDWAGALLRVFGVQGQMAERLKDVTGLTRKQRQVNEFAADAARQLGEAYQGVAGAVGQSSKMLSQSMSGGVAAAAASLPEAGKTFAAGLQDIFSDGELTARDRSKRLASHIQSAIDLDPKQGKEKVQQYLNTILTQSEMSPQAKQVMNEKIADVFSMEGMDRARMSAAVGDLLSGVTDGDIGKQGARSLEQFKNKAIEAQLATRGLGALPGLAKTNKDLAMFEGLLQQATGANLKLKNSFDGTNAQLKAVRQFTSEVLPALADSPLKDSLTSQAAAFDNFFEQRLNVMREVEAQTGEDRLKTARLNAQQQLDIEKRNLKSIESVRSQAQMSTGLSADQKQAIAEQTEGLRAKTLAQVESLEAAIAEADSLESLSRDRSKSLEAIEKERAALENKVAVYEKQKAAFAQQADLLKSQQSQARESIAIAQEEIVAIEEQIDAKRRAAGGDGAIVAADGSGQAQADRAMAEVQALEQQRAAKIEEVRSREASMSAADREIATQRESIQMTEAAIGATKRDIEVERVKANALRDLDTRQQLSSKAMEINTAVAQSNADAKKRVGVASSGLSAAVEKLAAVFGIDTKKKLENTVGTKANAKAQLSLAAAQSMAAKGTQGLNLQIAANTVKQQKWAKLFDVVALKQAAMAKGAAMASGATSAIGGAAKIASVGVKMLMVSFGPILAIAAAIGAAVAILSEFVPLLGGAAKQQQEMNQSLERLAAGTKQLNEARREAATTQEDLMKTEEKYNSLLAKTAVVMGKSFAATAIAVKEITGIGWISRAFFETGTSQMRDRLEQELDERKEALKTATGEEREMLEKHIEQIQDDLVGMPETWERSMFSAVRAIGDVVDSLMDDVRGVSEQFDNAMRELDIQSQQRLDVRRDLLAGDATTDKGKEILQQSLEERRSLTAAELKRLLKIEEDASSERIKVLETQIAETESIIEKSWDDRRKEEAKIRLQELQEAASFEQEKAKEQRNFLQQTQGVLATRADSAEFTTGVEGVEERLERSRRVMRETFEAEGLDPGKAIAKFNEISEAVNLSSEGQRRAADKLFVASSAYLDNIANLQDTALDTNQLDADIDNYISAIDQAVEAGTIGSSEAARLFQEIVDEQGELLKAPVRADLQQRLIDNIPAAAERSLRPVQALIDTVNHELAMGTKNQAQAAQEVFAAESEMLSKRLEAQREYAAAIAEQYGDESKQAREARKELLAMEREFAEQSIANRKKVFDATMDEYAATENRAMAVMSLSARDRQAELQRLVEEGVYSEQEADMLKVNSTKERVKLQIAFEKTRTAAIREELSQVEGDGPRRRELEQQLFASLKQQSELRVQAIEAEVAIRERSTERAVLGNQTVIDGIEREINAIQNRNRLLESANQLRQANDALDNFGIQQEVAAIEQAIGLQDTLNSLRLQPEYYAQAEELLRQTGQANKTEIQLLEDKQQKEMELAKQQHQQMLAQQKAAMTQLKAQLKMEELRAKAAIQEAEIAELKALQAQFAAQAALSSAMESGDADRIEAARLQVELAERGLEQSRTQIEQAQENLGVVEQINGEQIDALEAQQQLEREQSGQSQRQLAMQQQVELLQQMAALEREIAELESESLDNVSRIMEATAGLNSLKERQRDLEQQIVDSETEALRLLAEMEPNPRKRKLLEESIAQTKLESLRRAQEIQRNELEMTLRREEVELRISAIKNQAEQARAVAGVQTAQAQLDRVRASGGSQLEVRSAEAELQAALTNAIATGIEGAGIQEQLAIFDDYAATSREQLEVSQRMETFAARGELANSRASFGQGRADRRALERDIRNFYSAQTGIGAGGNEGDFFSGLRRSVRGGGRQLGELGISEGERGQLDMFDSLLNGFSEGGDLDSVLQSFGDRFVSDIESLSAAPKDESGTSGITAAAVPRARFAASGGRAPRSASSPGGTAAIAVRDRPPAPTLAPPSFDRTGGRLALPDNRTQGAPPASHGTTIEQLVMNNHVENNITATGDEGAEEMGQKLKQIAVDALHEATTLI